MDAVAEIKKLYYKATRASIAKDVARAIALLKTLPTEEERERAAVYMDGLSQMRSEWASASPGASASARPAAKAPARSGPSTARARRGR